MLVNIFALLVVYQLKHFIADYPLQGKYMLGKFKPGWDFLGPLSAHCGIHAAMTFIIATVYLGRLNLLALALAAFDFIAHFAMDRVKAGPKWLGRFKALSAKEFKEVYCISANDTLERHREKDRLLKGNTFFWWSLGLDQMWHHLTHYVVIFALLNQ